LCSKADFLAGKGSLKEFKLSELPGIGSIKGALSGYAGGSSVNSSNLFDDIVSGLCYASSELTKNTPKFADSTEALLKPTGTRTPFTLKQLKHLSNVISPSGSMGGLAHGGLPKKYQDATPDGHKPEFVTGITGYYADGRGTGQSDDIPALLHDGDYVMDAETVSALGDGSSKAGREVLEKFRSQVPHSKAAGRPCCTGKNC